MPWIASSIMQQRLRFVEEWAEEKKSRSALCREYGITRKSGYALWERFRTEGAAALEDGSRRPHTCPHRTPEAVEQRLVALRHAHPRWGPKKLRELLRGEGIAAPALSTVAEILRREGLSSPQRRRANEAPASPPLVDATAPHVVWSTDFKGPFYVGTGERCDPLTVLDLYSRYLLACHGYFTEPGKIRQEEVIEIYHALFLRHGLPRYILSDNGGPFSSTAPGGLTRLATLWIRLGIVPLRIDSGKPQQNGRIERLHRTLKSEVASPPRRTVEEQTRCLGEFTEEYNNVRPHEALALATPASVYRSAVPWNGMIPDPVFPQGAIPRRITRSGGLKWHGRMYRMPMSLADQDVGLVPVGKGDGQALIYLCMYCVGILEFATGRILRAPREALLLRVAEAPGTPGEPIVVATATL